MVKTKENYLHNSSHSHNVAQFDVPLSTAFTLFQLHYCWAIQTNEQIYKIFRHQDSIFLSIQSEQSESGISV